MKKIKDNKYLEMERLLLWNRLEQVATVLEQLWTHISLIKLGQCPHIADIIHVQGIDFKFCW
jgi:hypothetical protein